MSERSRWNRVHAPLDTGMCPGVFLLNEADRREHILREGPGRESGLIPAGLPRFEQR